ncbi:MAG: GGDEF domain-containing protein [Solirubrobacterales bacterium]
MYRGEHEIAAQDGCETGQDARRFASRRTADAVDVADALEEIGLSAKTGWYASILLYGAGGLLTVVLYLLAPDVIPVGVGILGLIAIGLSGASALGARYLSSSDWATHVRLCAGLAIFLVGAVIAGPARVAFLMLPLFVLLTPAFLYGARFAIPYTMIVTTFAFVVTISTPGHAKFAHAWVTVGAMWMIVASFLIAEAASRRLARENRILAFTDPLTGIANTRRLRERLAEALGMSAGRRRPFALFAIDLDNFKLVNDHFDHTTGDRVLKAIADALTDELEPDDLAARRGGDEFCVLVERPDERDLDQLAERFAAAIASARRRVCPQITPSGTVAHVRSRPGDTTASVLRRADDALHEAKRAFHAEHGARESVEIKPRTNPGDLRAVAGVRPSSAEDVAAAVASAYRPRRSSISQTLRRELDSARTWMKSVNLLWLFSAVSLVPAAVTMLILAPIGALDPLPVWIGILAGIAFLVQASVGVLAARHDWPLWVLNVGFLCATLIMTTLVALAGPAGTALIDMYPVLVLYGFYFLPPRHAATLMVTCMALYTGFAVGGGYEFGGLRAGVTDTVVFVGAALVVKARSVTMRFAKTFREFSEIDALTGVANLRALEVRAIDVVRGASPSFRPAIVTIDLDRFKQVNDVYNHTTGDQVLESVARAISETVRTDELVARRGGDEFFVVFENADQAHISAVVTRLDEAITHARRRVCPDLLATASIGSVEWEPGDSAVDFLHRADLNLLESKLQTRSRDYDRASA